MEQPGISREVLEKYLNRRVDELRAMRQYLEEARYQDIAMLSHKIKGSAPTFGLETVGQIAEKLEENAEKSAQNEVSELLVQMEKEVHVAIQKLT